MDHLSFRILAASFIHSIRRLVKINWTNTIVDFTPFSDEEVGPLIWATSNDFGEAKRVPVAAAHVDS